jgi:hypothetical protein
MQPRMHRRSLSVFVAVTRANTARYYYSTPSSSYVLFGWNVFERTLQCCRRVLHGLQATNRVNIWWHWELPALRTLDL